MKAFARCTAIILILLTLVGCGRMSPAPARQGDRARLDKIAELYKQGQYSKVVVQLKDYVALYPRDDLALTILGNTYRETQQPDEALAAYDAAVAVNPRQTKAITGRGVIFRMRNDYDAAMKCYEQAVEIDPKDAQAFSSMVMIALKRHDDANAVKYGAQGYALDKQDPVIAANLAVAYHYNKDVENRDKMAAIAEKLGYTNMAALRRIFAGELSIRD